MLYGQPYTQWVDSQKGEVCRPQPIWLKHLRGELAIAPDLIVSASAPLLPDRLVTPKNIKSAHVLSRVLSVYKNACLQIIMDSVIHEADGRALPVSPLYNGAIFTKKRRHGHIRKSSPPCRIAYCRCPEGRHSYTPDLRID